MHRAVTLGTGSYPFREQRTAFIKAISEETVKHICFFLVSHCRDTLQVESWDASLLFVHVLHSFLFDPMLMFLKKAYLATFTTLLCSFLCFDLADSLCDLFAD